MKKRYSYCIIEIIDFKDTVTVSLKSQISMTTTFQRLANKYKTANRLLTIPTYYKGEGL